MLASSLLEVVFGPGKAKLPNMLLYCWGLIIGSVRLVIAFECDSNRFILRLYIG